MRIVQLSDLHLTPRDSDARSEPKLFGKLTGMNRRFRALLHADAVQTADFVVVTGDVTDRGDVASWEVFRDGVEDAGLKKRVRVIPGNHDVCHLGMEPRVQTKEAHKKDREKLRAGLRAAGVPSRFPWAEKLSHEVALFCLDSNNSGNTNAVDNAVGTLRYLELERFARLLADHRDVPLKLVALHHAPHISAPPVAEKRGSPAMNRFQRMTHEIPAGERRAFRLLCVSHGVRVVMHGHLHFRDDRRVGGIRIMGVPASTEPRKDQPDAVEVTSYTVKDTKGGPRVYAKAERVVVGG